MRIYFTGSHSTGKSSLARKISKELGLPLLTEVARSVLAEKEIPLETLRTDLDLVDDLQLKISERQIKEEIKYENQSYVSDRSLDHLAYSANHGRNFNYLVNSPLTQKYIEHLNKPDTIIFFVRPSKITLKEDGTREKPDWDGILQIDGMIKMLLELWSLDYINLRGDSMQERIKTIMTVLKPHIETWRNNKTP